MLEARERAFRIYRELGDDAAAARVAIWLGCDCHDFRGEHAVANGWYRRAARLLRPLPPSPEHGWLAFQEGAYALELDDDTETARRRAAEAADIGRRLGSADLEFLALALEGLAYVTEGEVAEGMRRLDEASVAAAAGEVRDRVATTWTLCYVIYACERVRDFPRAAQWCHRMRGIATRFASEFAIGICRAHYGAVLVMNGDWEAAERELLGASDALSRTRPLAAMESGARLGELRRRQGRTEEAVEWFDRTEPHPVARLGHASLALDAGDALRARDIATDILVAIPAANVTQRADALDVLARALARLGDAGAAQSAAAELAGIAAAIGTRPLLAMAAQASGIVCEASGDLTGARRELERAIELFESTGLPWEAACARTDLARTLSLLGRAEAAVRQAGRAARRFRELGATAAAERTEEWVEGRRGAARESAGPLASLSARETEVLSLVAEGLTDREIGERLFISAHTVHRHVSNILMKLRLTSRAAAAALAARHGLAVPPPS